MTDKEHWLSKVKPLPKRRVRVAYQRTFTAAEAEKLRTGFWSQSMDDRWVIFLGESSLDLWRSWTGHCIYSLPARITDNGLTIGPLLINDDPDQYRRPTDAENIRSFNALIDRVLES